jgi:2-methylcitrate dehydratase PrpD
MANAAASHVTEQDDSSVFQPATFVFSPALAVAQAVGASGHDLLTASVAGYEVGIRIGELLSRSHYKIFHTSGTAGAVAAAGATGRLLNLTPRQMLHAIESASSEAAGLCEFLGDAADSKQLHTAHAAAAGLASAYVAKDGFTAEKHATEYIGAGKLRAAKPDKVTDSLRQRWATAETSFKYHASYRHTLPPAGTPLRTSRDEITAKVRSLIGFSGRTDAEALVARLWRIGELNRVAGIAS